MDDRVKRGEGCSGPLFQKNSRRLELSISKDTPHVRWGQGPGSVDPRFPASLPFPVPAILEFVAFRGSGKFSSNFPGTFPEFSSRTPEQTPETATAFSSFLIIVANIKKPLAQSWRGVGLPGPRDCDPDGLLENRFRAFGPN